MKKNHMKAIKGLSIAGIAVSAVLMLLMLLTAGAVAAVTPAVLDELGSQYSGNAYLDSLLDGYRYGYGDLGGVYDLPGAYSSALTPAAMAAVMGAVVFGIVFCAILCAACLVAGIITLRCYSDPRRYTTIFGWGIAASICGLLGSGGLLSVLFVLIAVFAGMDRKLYSKGAFCDEAGYFFMPAPEYSPTPGTPGPGYAPVPGGQPVPEPVTAAPGQVVTTVAPNAAAEAVQQPVAVPAEAYSFETQVSKVPEQTYMEEVVPIVEAELSKPSVPGTTVVQIVPDSQEEPVARIVSIEPAEAAPAASAPTVEAVEETVFEEEVPATFYTDPDEPSKPAEGQDAR